MRELSLKKRTEQEEALNSGCWIKKTDGQQTHFFRTARIQSIKSCLFVDIAADDYISMASMITDHKFSYLFIN